MAVNPLLMREEEGMRFEERGARSVSGLESVVSELANLGARERVFSPAEAEFDALRQEDALLNEAVMTRKTGLFMKVVESRRMAEAARARKETLLQRGVRGWFAAREVLTEVRPFLSFKQKMRMIVKARQEVSKLLANTRFRKARFTVYARGSQVKGLSANPIGWELLPEIRDIYRSHFVSRSPKRVFALQQLTSQRTARFRRAA